MTTTKKQYIQKSITVGLDDVTLKDINDAAKAVGAPNDARLATGGAAPKNAEQSEFYTYSATFSWSEEV